MAGSSIKRVHSIDSDLVEFNFLDLNEQLQDLSIEQTDLPFHFK